MPPDQRLSRVDTSELRLLIERKLGHEKADKYFQLLNRYLSLKLSKSEFYRHCISTIGRDNITLHNRLIQAIIGNACAGRTPPPKQGKAGSLSNIKLPNGYQRSSLQSVCRDSFPPSPRKGRTPNLRDRKLKDRPSPLGPQGKTSSAGCEDSVHKIQEQQSATELLSLGSRPPPEVNSVEEGEEVEQAAGSPSVYSRSPVRAPFGISIKGKESRKVLHHGSVNAFYVESCLSCGELPGTISLKTRLEQKLEMEGLHISMDCVNLLNNSLDVYLKRLMKPCLELAGSRLGSRQFIGVRNQMIYALNGMRQMRYVQKANGAHSASLLDFRVALGSNPSMLGEDWPVQLEKVCLHEPYKG